MIKDEMSYRVEGRFLLWAIKDGDNYNLFGEDDTLIGKLLWNKGLYFLQNFKADPLTKGEVGGIGYFLNKLNSNMLVEAELKSYVYATYVDGDLRYIGKGCDDRWKHTISGTSHVKELNKDLFSGRLIETVLVKAGLTDKDAFALETTLIQSFSGYGLYNTKGVGTPMTDVQINPCIIKQQSRLLASVREYGT